MKNINRDFYLSKLISKINDGSIKIITGLRRVGKSYLMNEIFYKYLSKIYPKNSIIKFAFDSPEDLEKIGENYYELYSKHKKVSNIKFSSYINKEIKKRNYKKIFLLLDEIQELDAFEGVLNGFLYNKKLDVYVTGSNSKLLISDVRTEFRGRGEEIRVYPLSFKEFYSVYKGDKYNALNEYMIYGGMPLVLKYQENSDKEKYLKDLFENTYLKDVIDRNHVKKEESINMLLDILSSDIGSLTNATKLANAYKSNKIKIYDKTVTSYINYFKDAFIIDKSERYDIKGKKYISSTSKYYFTDVGLRNARLNFRQIEPSHILENIIYNELKRRGYSVDVGIVHKYSKNKKGEQIVSDLEVDFVCNLGNKRYYIQSAYSIPNDKKMEQEQASLVRVPDSFQKIIVVNDNVHAWKNEKGITIMNVIEFLLDENSLDR